MPLSPIEAQEKAQISNKHVFDEICKDIDAQLEIRYDGTEDFKTMPMVIEASNAILNQVRDAYIGVGWLGTEYRRTNANGAFQFILRKRVPEKITGRG